MEEFEKDEMMDERDRAAARAVLPLPNALLLSSALRAAELSNAELQS